jgi:hypothetical protein
MTARAHTIAQTAQDFANLDAILNSTDDNEQKKIIRIKAARVDWLCFAIGKLGGPIPAAEEIGVSLRTVHRWLEKGLASAAFSSVIKLSRLTGVPLTFLARRMGPYEEHRFAA